jgi:hypothetical protein
VIVWKSVSSQTWVDEGLSCSTLKFLNQKRHDFWRRCSRLELDDAKTDRHIDKGLSMLESRSHIATVVVDSALRIVAAVMPPLLHFDLVTRTQGICLGMTFFALLSASIIRSWIADRPTSPTSDSDQMRSYLS